MTAAKMIWRNANEFHRNLDKADKLRLRNGRIAVRVEANRLRLAMKDEIRKGAPGGRKFKRLSQVAQGQFKKNTGVSNGTRSFRKPLKALAIPVRYWEQQHARGGSVFSVGYQKKPVINLRGGTNRNNQLSKSWIYLATVLQDGKTIPSGKHITGGGDVDNVSPRSRLLTRGFDKTGKKSAQYVQGARPFFIRKSTSVFKLPARPIIDPFWQAHRAEAVRNIPRNFERKMNGERI